MVINYTEIVGLAAGIITTVSFLPQIIKAIKTKDTKSISLVMYMIYLFGLCLYFVYAYMINEPALFITNSLSFFSGVIMLILKLKYK